MKTIKITFILISCLLFAGNKLMAQDPNDGNTISLTAEIVDHGSQLPSNSKSPVNLPQVNISGHVLYFSGSHAEFLLTLTDEDGNVVFTTTVYDTDTQTVLPSSLLGTYKLRLYAGIYCFVGEITLII